MKIIKTLRGIYNSVSICNFFIFIVKEEMLIKLILEQNLLFYKCFIQVSSILIIIKFLIWKRSNAKTIDQNEFVLEFQLNMFETMEFHKTIKTFKFCVRQSARQFTDAWSCVGNYKANMQIKLTMMENTFFMSVVKNKIMILAEGKHQL